MNTCPWYLLLDGVASKVMDLIIHKQWSVHRLEVSAVSNFNVKTLELCN